GEKMGMSNQRMSSTMGGHLYLQTNELRNHIVHYQRGADGTLTEAQRYSTGGAGSGVFKPVSGQESAPNAFEGANSVILSADKRFLFTSNGGDNSVSSFSCGKDGSLTLIDVKRTGNVVNGRSGTAKSLAYASSTRTLYVLHSFGPDHLRLMSVDAEGRLTPRAERYTANTTDKPNRIPTMVVLSPDQKFLVVGTTFDEPAHANPDGSPILWVQRPDGTPHSIASNAPDPDGLVVFRVNGDGALGMPTWQDGGGGSPFFPLFLRARPDTFILGFAVADGISINTLDAEGRVRTGPVVPINTDGGKPTAACWAPRSSEHC